jgi:chemotaxis protein histidine kinase CheA
MHTLKGAAGMMGFSVIQQTAHFSEDLLDRLVEQGMSLTPEVLSLLLDTSEALDFMSPRRSASQVSSSEYCSRSPAAILSLSAFKSLRGSSVTPEPPRTRPIR